MQRVLVGGVHDVVGASLFALGRLATRHRLILQVCGDGLRHAELAALHVCRALVRLILLLVLGDVAQAAPVFVGLVVQLVAFLVHQTPARRLGLHRLIDLLWQPLVVNYLPDALLGKLLCGRSRSPVYVLVVSYQINAILYKKISRMLLFG